MKKIIAWLLIILSSGAYAQLGEDYCKGGKVACLSQCFPAWKQEDGSINRRSQYKDRVVSRIEALKPLDGTDSESFWIECRVRVCSGNDAADAIASGNALCLPPSAR